MTRWGKVGILSSKSDITFFIIYEEYTICFGPMLCDSLHRYQSPKEIVFFNHLIKKPSINDILKNALALIIKNSLIFNSSISFYLITI